MDMTCYLRMISELTEMVAGLQKRVSKLEDIRSRDHALNTDRHIEGLQDDNERLRISLKEAKAVISWYRSRDDRVEVLMKEAEAIHPNLQPTDKQRSDYAGAKMGRTS